MSARDFVLARLGEIEVLLESASVAIGGVKDFFVDPEEDVDGKERQVMFEDISADIARANRAMELVLEAATDVDWREGLPGDEDGDEDDEDEDEPDAA